MRLPEDTFGTKIKSSRFKLQRRNARAQERRGAAAVVGACGSDSLGCSSPSLLSMSG
jgi:hypothetical protein